MFGFGSHRICRTFHSMSKMEFLCTIWLCVAAVANITNLRARWRCISQNKKLIIFLWVCAPLYADSGPITLTARWTAAHQQNATDKDDGGCVHFEQYIPIWLEHRSVLFATVEYGARVSTRSGTTRFCLSQSRWYDQISTVGTIARSKIHLAEINFRIFSRLRSATSARYPNLTALYSIGKSVQGRDLWVMVVSASPYEHMVGKPDVKYIGNIHGNEPVGKELLLHMIQYLVTSYTTDPYIRWLLDNTRIHILPSLNPDGYAIAKEGTCDGAQGRYDESHSRKYSKSNSNPFPSSRRFRRTGTMLEALTWIAISPITSNRMPNANNRKPMPSKSGSPKFNSCWAVHCMAAHWSPATHTITHRIPVSIKFTIRIINVHQLSAGKCGSIHHEIDPFRESWVDFIK